MNNTLKILEYVKLHMKSRCNNATATSKQSDNGAYCKTPEKHFMLSFLNALEFSSSSHYEQLDCLSVTSWDVVGTLS